MGLESVSCGALLQPSLFCSLWYQTRAQCQPREDFPQKGLVRDQTAVEGHDGLHRPQNMSKFVFQNRLRSLLAGILESHNELSMWCPL